MNIYLDIDGVLRGTASPPADVEALVAYILAHFPDSTYWLTTHCRHDYNHCATALKSVFSDDFIARIMNVVQPTDWEALKTDAIDFGQDFVWFDDNLFEGDRVVLVSHHAEKNFFRMNPRDPNMAKLALEHLQSPISAP